jgi:hypothetical protein
VSVLARLFGAIGKWFETRATAGQMAAKIEALEARQVVLENHMAQLRMDMAKCKFVVGLNQVTEVTARDE